ncbi:MAG: hypothetical protein J6Y08_08525 [Clostridiales bacterium]|nr:hypothetical protein [Clostridiales bacterium]
MTASKKNTKGNADGADKQVQPAMSFKKEDIFDTLTDMLSELLDMPKSDFKMDTAIFEELPLDSLQLYELVVDLESKYALRIPDEAIEKVSTIEDVVEMVHGAKETSHS